MKKTKKTKHKEAPSFLSKAEFRNERPSQLPPKKRK